MPMPSKAIEDGSGIVVDENPWLTTSQRFAQVPPVRNMSL